MTLFEVVDAAGAVHLVAAEGQYIGEDENGQMRHDFVGVRSQDAPAGVLLPTIEHDEPLDISFTNPRSVREVAP